MFPVLQQQTNLHFYFFRRPVESLGRCQVVKLFYYSGRWPGAYKMIEF